MCKVAGIDNYSFFMWYVEKRSLIPKDLKFYRTQYYDHAISVANLLETALSEKDILCFFEDDAYFRWDFQSVLEAHINQLPFDWKILMAGHTGWPYSKEPESYLKLTDLVGTVDYIHGFQCVCFQAGEWRAKLINDIKSNKIFYDAHTNNCKWVSSDGRLPAIDCLIFPWCRENNLKIFISNNSFCGQDVGQSLITDARFIKTVEGFNYVNT